MTAVTATVVLTMEKLTLTGLGTLEDRMEYAEDIVTFSDDVMWLTATEVVTSVATFLGDIVAPFIRTSEVTNIATFIEVTTSSQTTLIPSGTASFKDSVSYTTTMFYSDVATFSDTVTFSREVQVENAVVFTGSVVDTNTASLSVSSAVSFSDAIEKGLLESVQNIATFTDTITALRSTDESITNAATFSDSVVIVYTPRETVQSTVVFVDSVISSGSRYLEEVSSTVTFEDAAASLNYDAVAWVLNTESTGITNYQNYDFRSLAEFNGVLYGVNSFGVYALTGSSDAGRQIDAVYKTGFWDFRTEFKKRISDIYIGYTSDGVMECDVETQSELFTYEMPERAADAPLNNRIKPGKGLSSRYWRFTLRNTDGADFQIFDIAADVAKSTNRRL